MPLEMLKRADAPLPVVRREFDAEFDIERGRRLRVRLIWFCSIMIVLGLLSVVGTCTDFQLPHEKFPGWPSVIQELATAAVVLLPNMALLLACLGREPARRKLVNWFTGVAIFVGISLIILTPMGDNSDLVPGATLEATPQAAAAQQWAVIFTLAVIQVIAATLVALTPREAFRIIIPLTVAYGVEAFVHPHLPAYAAFLFTGIALAIAMRGLIWSWWRYRRFQETYHGTALSKRYDEISSELDHARKVHEALFPPPVNRGGLRMAYRYEPMRQIGGDFLYAHPLSFPPTTAQQKLSVLVMDVTGHGVSAALAVNRLYVELTRIFTSAEHPTPDRAIRELNAFACETLASQGMFATAICLQVEMEGGVARRVSWCNAGHPPAMLRRGSGAVEELGPGSPMLGVVDGEAYPAESESRELAEGDLVIAYTDGAVEAANAARKDFGIEGVRAVLQGWNGPVASGQVAADILRRVTQHRHGPTKDDILVVELLSAPAQES